LAAESERGSFQERLNSDRDAYMWLEAYPCSRGSSATNAARAGATSSKKYRELAADSAEGDFPDTSRPSSALRPITFRSGSTVYLAGLVFGNQECSEPARASCTASPKSNRPKGSGASMTGSSHARLRLHDVHRRGPLYEHSKDPAALEALRRGLEFHKYFTYPDGSPVEVLDDRNRYTSSMGGTCRDSSRGPKKIPRPGAMTSLRRKAVGFSNFPDGRRHAELLTSFFRAGEVGYEIGPPGAGSLYYHAGPSAPIPQDSHDYTRRLTIPAGDSQNRTWWSAFPA